MIRWFVLPLCPCSFGPLAILLDSSIILSQHLHLLTCSHHSVVIRDENHKQLFQQSSSLCLNELAQLPNIFFTARQTKQEVLEGSQVELWRSFTDI